MKGVGSAQGGVLSVHDEFGQRWLVYREDIGWEHCRTLYLRGLRDIVLPRHTLRTGEVVPVSVPKTMGVWDVTNPALATLLVRYVRLQDCVEALRGTTAIRTDEPAGEGAAVA